MFGGLQLRPYQLLCLFCAQGGDIPEPQRSVVSRAADAIRQRPDLPVTLRCLAQDVYAYQDVEPAAGESGSTEFRRKRDLDILQCLDLPPGSTLPARTLLFRVLKAITTTEGLCDSAGATSTTWRGCPASLLGQFERGLTGGLAALAPLRSTEEMARDKAASVAAMHEGNTLRIRPHVIMCAVCNYGKCGGHPEPLAADNIVEFVEIIRERPDDVQIEMAPGADWMICAPCPQRVPELNACVNVAGSGGLSNEKRDLDLLRVLDLAYGAALPARDMLRLLFTRVPDTSPICRRCNPGLSVWWDGCGEANCLGGNAGYVAGRKLLCDELHLD